MEESRAASELASRRTFLTTALGSVVLAGCSTGKAADVAASAGSAALPKTEAALASAEAAGGRGQMFVWRDGRTLLDRGFGPGVTSVSLVPWASACKPTTVAAVLRLVEAGEVRLDDKVTRFIPNFGQNGKDDVTIWNLMTHTAALGGYDGPLNLPTWDETISKIVAAPRAGARNQGAPPPLAENRPFYNPAGIWILGEVLTIVHKRPFPEIIRSETYLPLDMKDSWNGMPQDRYAAYGGRIIAGGFRGDAVASAAPRRRAATAPQSNPAGGGVGPVHELGNFYRMALDGGTWRGKRLLKETTLREATRVQASDGGAWTFGLGFNVNKPPTRTLSAAEDRLRYGRRPSPATFGHNGATGLVAFADPEPRLVIVMIGLPLSVSDGVYEDLGLA